MQNTEKQNYPGLVAPYDTQAVNEMGIFCYSRVSSPRPMGLNKWGLQQEGRDSWWLLLHQAYDFSATVVIVFVTSLYFLFEQ